MGFSLVWPRRGNKERSAPPIASRRGQRAIGVPERIRSRARGHACAHGSRPSPTVSVKNSSRAFSVNCPASSQMVSSAHFSAGSESGDRPPRGNSFSRRRQRTPHRRQRICLAKETAFSGSSRGTAPRACEGQLKFGWRPRIEGSVPGRSSSLQEVTTHGAQGTTDSDRKESRTLESRRCRCARRRRLMRRSR